MVINGSVVNLNGGANTGTLADIAASINASGVTGISATVSGFGNGATTGRLLILGFVPQMPASGMTLANSTNSPLNTLKILPNTYYPPVPPHAWAEAKSETVGSGTVFATSDAFSLGYSTDTANTTEIGPIGITVGTGSNALADGALAINEAVITAGWSVTTTFAANAAQGTPLIFLSSIAGLTIGMPAYDPSHLSGQSPAFLAPGTVILAIYPVAGWNPATGTSGWTGYAVTLSGGVQSAQTAGASIVFGKVKADVENATTSGAALRIRNMVGGSLWLTDGTGTPLSKISIWPGRYWPGCLPPRLQHGLIGGYNSIAAGGSLIRADGQYSTLSTDPVTAPRSVLRATGEWRQAGIELQGATFDSNVAILLTGGQTINWGSNALTVNNGTLEFNTTTLAAPIPSGSLLGNAGTAEALATGVFPGAGVAYVTAGPTFDPNSVQSYTPNSTTWPVPGTLESGNSVITATSGNGTRFAALINPPVLVSSGQKPYLEFTGPLNTGLTSDVVGIAAPGANLLVLGGANSVGLDLNTGVVSVNAVATATLTVGNYWTGHTANTVGIFVDTVAGTMELSNDGTHWTTLNVGSVLAGWGSFNFAAEVGCNISQDPGTLTINSSAFNFVPPTG
jgi:hypothetical protein